MAENNRKKLLIFGLVAALILGLGGLWWALRDKSSEAADGEGGDGAASVDPEQALEAKRKARLEMPDIDPVSVGGRVISAEDGEGIADAVVLLSRKGIIQGLAPEPGQPSRPLMARTDENGGWEMTGIAPGRYMLSSTADGFIPATRTDIRVRGGEDQMDFDLEMRAGGSRLSGTVSDIGGGPIEGVLVRVQDSSGANFGFKHAPLAAVSDENGRYSLQVGNGRYALSTYHPDYVGGVRLTEVLDADRVEDFKLVPGGVIEGVVRMRPDGEPVAGARVSFMDSRNGDMGGFTSNLSIDGSVVVSDEDGRFRLHGLRAGVVSISARAPGHATASPVEVPLGIGEAVSEVELWVDPAYTISGFVVPKGDPEGAVEGVLVGAWQMAPPSLLVASTPSSSDGYFEIVGVPPGTWQVGAVGEEHLFTLTGATAIIKDQNVDDVLIELESGVRVRGRVDPAGPARVGVRIDPENASLGNIGGLIGDGMASATADENGEFELGPLAPGGGLGGRKLIVTAETDSGYRGELSIDLGKEDLEGVVIPMTKGASVSGTVLDQNGVPQAGVIVSVSPVEQSEANINMNFGGGPAGDGAPTGEDGKFAVRGLDTGDHLVLVKDSKGRALSWAPGFGPGEGEGEGAGEGDRVEPLELAIEDTVNEQFLDLRVVPRDGVIEGVVLDADGLPVADAWVTASVDMGMDEWMRSRRPTRSSDEPERAEAVMPETDDEGGGRDWTQSAFFAEQPVLTDENGFFVIKELRRDRAYNLVAEGERGGARATQEEVQPGSRVTLNLESLGGIDGVVTAGGDPVSQYSLSVSGPVNRNKAVNDPKGAFSIDRLDPGKYEITVESETGGLGSAEVELGASGRERVEIELEAWGSIRGELVGMQDGEPMSGLMIMVNSEGSMTAASSGMGLLTGKGPKTDGSGQFRVDKIAPGKGSVTFLDPDVDLSGAGQIATAEFELAAGEELDLGTIKGVQSDSVPKDERGTLEWRIMSATWEDRPRPPGTDLDADEARDPEGDAGAERERLWVRSVDVGGVADEAGVVPGDEILSIDGQSVTSTGAGTARQTLSSARIRVGQELRLELRRGEERVDVKLIAVKREE